MSARRKPRFHTLEEYFDLEKSSEVRYEYRNSVVKAMSGAQPNHNRVLLNVGGEIRAQLKDRACEVFGSEQRVEVHVGSPYLYPDVSVACPRAEFKNVWGLDVLTNPTVIFEILSPTTAGDDWGTKFIQYQTIETLREYVLIDPDEVYIAHYTKQSDGTWRPVELENIDETLDLKSVDCRLPLAEIYHKVRLTKSKSRSKRRPKPVQPL